MFLKPSMSASWLMIFRWRMLAFVEATSACVILFFFFGNYNLTGRQIPLASGKEICLFTFSLIWKHSLFAYAFFFLNVSYCTFYLSGLFNSLCSSCERVSACVSVKPSLNLLPVWFSACWVSLRSMYVFTVMTWCCLIVFFYFLCVAFGFFFSFQSTLISLFCTAADHVLTWCFQILYQLNH